MSFFNMPKFHEEPAAPAADSAEKPWEEGPKERIDPRMVIIDGANLIKLVEDNPDIQPGKTDKGIAQLGMWQPVNYNPDTGEMI